MAWLIGIVLLAGVSIPACTTRREYIAANEHERPTADAININTATAAELESVPRIGPKTAAVIVKFREDNGPFKRVEHLMQVRGISERRFTEIRPYLRTE